MKTIGTIFLFEKIHSFEWTNPAFPWNALFTFLLDPGRFFARWILTDNKGLWLT